MREELDQTRSLLQANQPVMNAMATDLKAKFTVPGISVWSEQVVSSRSR